MMMTRRRKKTVYEDPQDHEADARRQARQKAREQAIRDLMIAVLHLIDEGEEGDWLVLQKGKGEKVYPKMFTRCNSYES